MGEILLSELIERTKDSIRSFEYSQSTFYQYCLAWRELCEYFIEHHQVLFSRPLADQYVRASKAKLDAGVIKKWRYKLNRLTVQMLIACDEHGHFMGKQPAGTPSTRLHESVFIPLHTDYLNSLTQAGKGAGTIQIYEIVSRQFLEYLGQRRVKAIADVRVNEIGAFIPFISKQYQPTSMRTVLSALRSFLRFVESQHLTEFRLSQALPSSSGRKISIVPTLTPEEEQKLLGSVAGTPAPPQVRATPVGKRNYAMLLLALRTGLRSIDIVNLKLGDIQWRSNILEIIQAKTGHPLVLPLLTEVGNALADYILNGRPVSPLPYVFLRSQAPYRKLCGRSACYAISCKMMKDAGIRQAKEEQKGFHSLHHSLAARLLAEETPLPIISNILGHQNKDSTKIYLSTDLTHLRACALGLTGIEISQEELR